MSDSEEEVEYEVEEVALCTDITLLVTTVAYMPITTLMRNQGKGVEISGQKVWCGSLGVVEVSTCFASDWRTSFFLSSLLPFLSSFPFF